MYNSICFIVLIKILINEKTNHYSNNLMLHFLLQCFPKLFLNSVHDSELSILRRTRQQVIIICIQDHLQQRNKEIYIATQFILLWKPYSEVCKCIQTLTINIVICPHRQRQSRSEYWKLRRVEMLCWIENSQWEDKYCLIQVSN